MLVLIVLSIVFAILLGIWVEYVNSSGFNLIISSAIAVSAYSINFCYRDGFN